MTAERKLEYLRRYMDEWVDKWPGCRPTLNFRDWLIKTTCKEANLERHRQLLKEKEQVRMAKLVAKKLAIAKEREANCRCYYCERMFGYQTTGRTKDHIVPKIEGGGNKPENIVNSCYNCNQWKGRKLLGDWAMELTSLIVSGGMSRNRFAKRFHRTEVEKILINIRKLQSERFHKKGQIAA